MALITEAGWPQIPRSQCETLLVPGTRNVRIELRAGDVATVLTAWAAWWHANVRPIEPADGHRNWWGWSATNTIATSNHLSGTAVDLCADELPWKSYRMPADQVAKVREGLRLFEGTVFWGRDWGPGQQDEMHSQVGYDTYGSPKFAAFAARLRAGHLGVFAPPAPPDPDAFPLPAGHYYGPLLGPAESVSGDYDGEPPAWRDGLARWQHTLGIPTTRRWDDGTTPKAAYTLQRQRRWPPNPAFGYGGVYPAEWNAVIRDGWRLPDGWTPAAVPDADLSAVTVWGDYSQYQAAHLDGTYPYPVVAFRASIADQRDTKFVENMRRARALADRGRIKKIIAYHFWVPGVGDANFTTFRDAVEAAGGVFPELAAMLDVEDGGTKWKIRGDQTLGVTDFVRKARAYLGHRDAVAIYTNFVANPDLLPGIKTPDLADVKLIVPRYHDPNTPPKTPPDVAWFGHQYTDRADTPPFGPSDLNRAPLPLTDFLAAWGTNTPTAPTTPDPTPDPTPNPTPDPGPPPSLPPVPPELFTEVEAAIAAQFA